MGANTARRGVPGRRMLCTDCGTTGPARTRVGGSDALELLGWLAGIVPGLLYCWWRHASRLKVCTSCGSPNLVREARAARRAAGDARAPEARPLPDYAGWHPAWLGAPGDRLRRLRGGSALAVVGVAAWAAVSLDLIAVRPGPAAPVRAPVPASPQPTPEALAEAARARARALARLEGERGAGQGSVRGVRERECRRLCADFHPGSSSGLQRCLERCLSDDGSPGATPIVGARDAASPGAAGRGEADPCADHPDPVGCRFELGPISVR